MTPSELVFRIILAILFPPLGVIGLPNVGCGTLLLLFLLTCIGVLPGQIVAIILIVQEYNRSNCC